MSGGIAPLILKLGLTLWLLCLMCQVNGKHDSFQCQSGNLAEEKERSSAVSGSPTTISRTSGP